MFQIIPAIDLKEGQCVRLKQGKMSEATIYDNDPVKIAEKWFNLGSKRLHIVDLDGAFAGKPVNLSVIRKILDRCPDLSIQIGGGIRHLDTLKEYFNNGASYCIIGTSAVKNPDFFQQACQQYPDRIILGVDAWDGFVALEGWDEKSTLSSVELSNQFSDLPIHAIVYTDIKRDGMLQGVNLQATQKLAENSPFPIIASGGVKSIKDIKSLLKIQQEIGDNLYGVIAGKALYDNRLDLTEAIQLINE